MGGVGEAVREEKGSNGCGGGGVDEGVCEEKWGKSNHPLVIVFFFF